MSLQFKHISAHMIQHRMERYIFIQTNTGIGNPVMERYVPERNHIELLTDTGVLIVTDTKKETLITCYYVKMDKVIALYGGEPVPTTVRNTIKKNMKKNFIFLQNNT